MVFILVAASVAALLLAQWYFVQRRKRVAANTREVLQFREAWPASELPHGVFLHPGHVWARVHGDGLVSVGVSHFAAGFAGRLAAVELPKVGQRLHADEPACTLVAARRRHLDLATPVEGKVLAVNEELLKDPGLLQQRPYDKGWLYCLRSRRLRDAFWRLMEGPAAQEWITAARDRVAGFSSPALGLVAQDGGYLVDGFGDCLDDAQWRALCRELFPTRKDLKASA